MKKILCTGKADQFGYCDKCHNRVYGTSVYCTALSEPTPPQEDNKTIAGNTPEVIGNNVYAQSVRLPDGFIDMHICSDGRLIEGYGGGLCSREPSSKSFSFYTTKEEIEKFKSLFTIKPKPVLTEPVFVKGSNTREAELKAMTEYASLKEQEAHNRAVQECIEKVREKSPYPIPELIWMEIVPELEKLKK